MQGKRGGGLLAIPKLKVQLARLDVQASKGPQQELLWYHQCTPNDFNLFVPLYGQMFHANTSKGRVGYEEFCRSRRVLSTEAEGLCG